MNFWDWEDFLCNSTFIQIHSSTGHVYDVLVLTNILSEHFQLHYLRLPKDISEDHVILMDCTVSTGAAAMMAVRVLLVRGSWLFTNSCYL